MDEGDIEELLAVVPEELSNEEMVEMEQEHIAVQEARGKETTGKAPQETPQENPQWRGQQKLNKQTSTKLPKMFENMKPYSENFSLIK